jgi:hypothetical protein
MIKQLFFARAGAFDVDGGENAPIDQGAVEVDLHVAGAFELLENDFVHPRTGVHESGGQDRQGSTFLNVARRAKEAFGLMQGVGVDAAGQDLAGMRLDGVVSAGKRVMESSRMTTSFLCSTMRRAFSITISATCTWRSAVHRMSS